MLIEVMGTRIIAPVFGSGLFVLVEARRSAFPEIATTPQAVAAEIAPVEDLDADDDEDADPTSEAIEATPTSTTSGGATFGRVDVGNVTRVTRVDAFAMTAVMGSGTELSSNSAVGARYPSSIVLPEQSSGSCHCASRGSGATIKAMVALMAH